MYKVDKRQPVVFGVWRHASIRRVLCSRSNRWEDLLVLDRVHSLPSVYR